MKRILLLALGVLPLGLTLSGAEPSPSTPSNQKVMALVREIQTQQAAIADNQAKIEAKLVTVGEAVRVARIYSSRGGH